MILVDSRKGSAELLPLIKRLGGVQAELSSLPFGDFTFEGNGPRGVVSIGVERKTLHDILNCIDDSRFSGHQKVGMIPLYAKSYLLVEGMWRPHDQNGQLMEGFRTKDGKVQWGFCRYLSRPVMYSKLRRYLFSVAMSKMEIMYTLTPEHTAIDVAELYHYWQKRWQDHTSMLQVQEMALPSLGEKPPLVREWAARLTGIGVKHSLDAQRIFKTGGRLANADERQWLQVPGVGVKTALSVVKEIWEER
jgi:ERCC4-type nuclease